MKEGNKEERERERERQNRASTPARTAGLGCPTQFHSFQNVDNRTHSRTVSDTIGPIYSRLLLHKDLNNLKWFFHGRISGTMPNSRIFQNFDFSTAIPIHPFIGLCHGIPCNENAMPPHAPLAPVHHHTPRRTRAPRLRPYTTNSIPQKISQHRIRTEYFMPCRFFRPPSNLPSLTLTRFCFLFFFFPSCFPFYFHYFFLFFSFHQIATNDHSTDGEDTIFFFF